MEPSVEANLYKIRNAVIKIKEKESHLEEYSETWKACTDLLAYLTELSPKNLRNIRLHTEIFSGEHLNFILFNAHTQNAESYSEGLGYTFATENLPQKYWLSEPPIFEWIFDIGCKYKNVIINPEIARYQLYVENFVQTGMFQHIENSQTKTVIMEIGAGYGPIAHAILNRFPKKTCYIVIDLPIMLLFTGCYIATHHPDANIFIYDPENTSHQQLDDAIFSYDLVLIPNHKLSVLSNISKIDYVINTISLAEMTIKQVEDYLDFIKPRLKKYFYFQNYSWNHNEKLHHLVGKKFLSKPNLSFYEDYIQAMNLPERWDYLQTFYFCTSETNIEYLAKCKIKLRLPDTRAAQLDLADDSITIRYAPHSYKKDKRFIRSGLKKKRILLLKVLNKLQSLGKLIPSEKKI